MYDRGAEVGDGGWEVGAAGNDEDDATTVRDEPEGMVGRRGRWAAVRRVGEVGVVAGNDEERRGIAGATFRQDRAGK